VIQKFSALTLPEGEVELLAPRGVGPRRAGRNFRPRFNGPDRQFDLFGDLPDDLLVNCNSQY
jgi:hypothetical protein